MTQHHCTPCTDNMFFLRTHSLPTHPLLFSSVQVWNPGVRLVVFVVACLLSADVANAQPTESGASSKLTETQQLIQDSIEGRQLTEPADIVHAAQLLLDVKLYDDVKKLLLQFEGLNLDDQRMIKLTNEVGSAFFSEVFQDPNLQPEGRRIGQTALSNARKGQMAPGRISRLIDSLNADDISARTAALRRLRFTGEPAVAELLNQFTRDEQIDSFPGIRTALQALAAEYPEPVLAAAYATDLQVKLEAVRALRAVDSNEALAALYLAYLLPDQNQLIQSTALDMIGARQNALVQPEEIEHWFHQQTNEVLSRRSVSLLEQHPEFFWAWDRQRGRLTSRESNSVTNRYQTAARYARGLYRSNPQSARNRRLYCLTQLELAKRKAGPNVNVNADQWLLRLELSAQEVNQLIPHALRLKLYPAATACCELIKSTGDNTVLNQLVGNYPPLTHGLLSGERSVQFAALDAVITLDPKRAFAGASHAVSLAVYLASGTGQPAALIGHHRLDIGQSYAATVASSGLTGEAARTGQELFKLATTNSDIEVILVSDSITQPAFGNLIQQLRSDWRTKEIPIALLFSDDVRGNIARSRLQRQGVTVIPFTADPSLVASTVDRMVDQVTPFRQDRVERIRQSKVAIEWLAKVATSRKDYAYLELTPHDNTIRELIFRPGFSRPVSEILGSLATPHAQRQLVNYASELSLPVDQRQNAVAAFSQAVDRTGVLLTQDEVLLQYDRYNASAQLPPATQRVLGAILDIIEASNK